MTHVDIAMFPSELSHHDKFWSCHDGTTPTTFWSCHLTINRSLSHDHRHVCDLVDADVSSLKGISAWFFDWTPSTNANISPYYAHFAVFIYYMVRYMIGACNEILNIQLL